ncbi:hypothetical protein PAHAL_9G034000 [Panicum hallii]|uniref:Uncharacterized protein n=2 Tax=Paniceae TaxID=147428 RepID=A0A2T8I024_9POAL|nr:hypothetical protein PAHAL_9G034000 [Panicum hallii]
MANSIRLLDLVPFFFPSKVGKRAWRLGPKFNLLELAGAARTRTPSTTNYDVHSPTWGDGKPTHPPSAMRAIGLGHGSS